MQQDDPGPSASRRRAPAGPRALGRVGEDMVADWYQAHGYEVLSRNWTCRSGELDIVARRGPLHVFCEVKARSSTAFGLPAEAVGPLKQARVRRLAAMWFATEAAARCTAASPVGTPVRRGGPVRFDVACVLAGVVEVIEAAF
jgi:putative endonuclease